MMKAEMLFGVTLQFIPITPGNFQQFVGTYMFVSMNLASP
jgi:hypothetical protein